ncbi:galactose-binding domain-like protein [Mycena alexandri]|uniref:Galactose-binding domain-like protein n=1 Tax=Mycena alexandri TaxID=1745969 RepID=A0AAD6TDK5_9AGAR|nr:galactose-binding domain-like protein [Mycena alexandri]
MCESCAQLTGCCTNSAKVSLLEHIDLQQVNCLNESGDHTFSSIVAGKALNTSTTHLLSDADEQLLLNIPFHQTVRVRALVIKSSGGEQAPKRVKLFVNRPSLGFDDVQDAEEPEAAQVLDISEEDVKSGRPIPLRFVRFQTVTSLHARRVHCRMLVRVLTGPQIFVFSNQGEAEETRIDAVDFLGVTAECVRSRP